MPMSSMLFWRFYNNLFHKIYKNVTQQAAYPKISVSYTQNYTQTFNSIRDQISLRNSVYSKYKSKINISIFNVECFLSV